MAHFHLIHGAWHGAWAWEALIQCLQRAGHTAQAIDLPGCGAAAKALGPEIGLEDHIQAALPKRPAILVAHSYGGMVARGVCDRAPEMVSGVVLIEALWPEHGQSALDAMAPAMRARLEAQVDGGRLPPVDPRQFQLGSPEREAFVRARMGDHPWKTFTDPFIAQSPAAPPPIGLYILSTDRDPQPYQATADRLKAAGWRVATMPGGHELMLTACSTLAALLSEFVQEKTL